MGSKPIVERPVLPQGVAYRHSLGIYITLTLMIEFLVGAITLSNHLNRSSWMFLWGSMFITLPFVVVWRVLWLEKHGWWQRRTIVIPELPVQMRGLDWRATFEAEQVVAQGGQLAGPSRILRYANLKRVEFGNGGLNLIESGKAPVTLGRGARDDVIVALLARHAPHAEFRGEAALMRDGWQRRN